MLSSGLVVAVGLLLSSHGSEGTREEKFRGALLAQNSAEVRGAGSPLDPKSELAALRTNRPSFGTGTALLIAGGAFSLLGSVVVGVVFASATAFGEGGVWVVVFGAGLFGLGLVLGVIGGIVMAVVGAELTRADARIRELEGATQPQSQTQLFSVPPRLVLARF